jgi:hypothetical protein
MPTPIKVSTPGRYKLANKSDKKRKKSSGKKGRPTLTVKKRKGSSRKHYMATYRAEDMCKNEGYSIAAAAKAWGVPRVTLLERLKGNYKSGVPGGPLS